MLTGSLLHPTGAEEAQMAVLSKLEMTFPLKTNALPESCLNPGPNEPGFKHSFIKAANLRALGSLMSHYRILFLKLKTIPGILSRPIAELIY